ncbi:hypothetical protein NMG60_11027755 [Bertholletia excelsa]
MVTQLVTLASFRQPTAKRFVQEASYEGRGSSSNILSLCQNLIISSRRGGSVDRVRRSGGKKLEEDGFQRPGRGTRSRRVGFWLLASSANHVLKKGSTVLRKWLCRDSPKHPRVKLEVGVPPVDPYFSIPVLPPTT